MGQSSETPTPSSRRLVKDYFTQFFFGHVTTISHGQVQAYEGEEAYAEGPHLEEGSEDLAREQAEKDAAKNEAIAEIVPPLDIEGYEEGDLIEKCKLLYTWVMEAEEKRLAMEMSLVKQDYDVNELTLSCSEGTGKFMKPQLKRVAKTAAIRSGLKATTNPDQKFDLGEEKEKPAFGADALGKKKGEGTATESAAEAPVEAAAEE